MTRLSQLLISLVVLFGLNISAQAETEIQRIISPGGIEAWLVEDDTIPIISLSYGFRGGAASDPVGQEGLTNFVSGLLDEGAGDLDSQAFQARLADLNISLGFSGGRDRFTGTLRTLRENRDAAFDMLRLALTESRFDEEPVERIRSQLLRSLEQDKTDPDYLSGRRFFATLFEGHPYARPTRGTIETITALSAETLSSFPARRFTRDRLVVGVSGALSGTELGLLLDKTFGGLTATSDLPKIPDVPVITAKQIEVIELPVPQSSALFGLQGFKRDDPDFIPAYVLNYILGGGGFSSRLMEEVREKRGLAYSVYSYLYPLDHAGLWLGGVATQNSRMAESLEVINEVLDGFANGDISEEDLRDAKTYLTGAYALRFDTNAKIAPRLVSLQMNDLGIDYTKTRNSLIDAVTLDDIKRVAKLLIDTDRLFVVVAGAPENLPNAKIIATQ